VKPGKFKKNGDIGFFYPPVLLDTPGVKNKIQNFGEANRSTHQSKLRIPRRFVG
jgi:hypothetical protein